MEGGVTWFEVWTHSKWLEDNSPHRVGRYRSRVDAEKAITQWSGEFWIEEKTEL
jgi:hypothetical protein